MKFLVTNDDSLDCVFLHVLVRTLREAGHELYVVAPKTEQSWIGAAKSRHRRVHSTTADRGFGCPTWMVDGTPSDCVNIGLAHLLPVKPDAVVSGINVGLNASLSFIPASGTIAGAWEGVVHGLPAIALSQHLTFASFDKFKRDGGRPDDAVSTTLAATASHASRLIPDLVAHTPPRSFILHNLNFPFPCTAATEVRRTVPAQVIVPGLFSPQADDGTHNFVFAMGEDIDPPAGPLTDRAALMAGHISHSVLDYKKLCTL
jgi:5'-nucleotidase